MGNIETILADLYRAKIVTNLVGSYHRWLEDEKPETEPLIRREFEQEFLEQIGIPLTQHQCNQLVVDRRLLGQQSVTRAHELVTTARARSSKLLRYPSAKQRKNSGTIGTAA